jgi:hypothetical protein
METPSKTPAAADFGITEFASSELSAELPCVFKRLYTDFIVVEIGPDGQKLVPNFEVKKEEEEEEKISEPPAEEEEMKRPDLLDDEIMSRIDRIYGEEIDDEHVTLNFKVYF